MKQPIRVVDTEFNLVTELDQYESVMVVRSWHGIGSLELRINRHIKDAHLLTKGHLLILGASLHKAYVILHREIALNESGKESETWNIQALSLKSLLGKRATLPPSHTAYDNKQGPAETVMKHYVNNNVITPVDVNRVIEDVILSENLERGITLSWQSRFKNLAEELAEQSLFSGLGWNVQLDIINKKFVFDIQEGRDLTVNQTVLPPAIFSPEFETLGSLQYTESELNYKNVAYVAGQGEGVERRVIELGTASGWDRNEIFVDARDIAEEIDVETMDGEGNTVNVKEPRPEQEIIQDLTARGEKELQGLLQEHYLEGQMLTNSRLIYEKDYDLGDIVTIQNKDWGVTMNARITEIKEIYETSGFRVEATFGNNRPTFIQKIKKELSQLSGEVRR